MPEIVKVRPADPATIVRMPDRQMRRMAPEGETVELDAYWQARLRDGSVVLAEAEVPPVSSSSKKK